MTAPTRLTPKLITSTAIRLADTSGLGGLTMRKLAAELGVQAMSLYHHVANKERLLDAMVDDVYARIGLPDRQLPWKEAMLKRAQDTRLILRRHHWAAAVMNSRPQPGPATLAHHDAVLAQLRSSGFSVALAAHAFSAIDAYIFGFALTEAALPFETAEEAATVGHEIARLMGSSYPAMTEMLTEHVFKPDYSYAREFEFGLALILDGLQEKLDAETRND